jgi:hypothetical protein
MLTVLASRWDRNTAFLASLVRDPCAHLVFTKLIVTALKWFDGEGTVSNYEGGRDLEALVALYVSFFLFGAPEWISHTTHLPVLH